MPTTPHSALSAVVGAALLVTGCAAWPEAPPGVLDVTAARYTCDDGTTFTARFDGRADTVTLYLDRDFRMTLMGQRPASGIWYAGGGWELRGKGVEAILTRPDGRAAVCTVQGERPVQSSVQEL